MKKDRKIDRKKEINQQTNKYFNELKHTNLRNSPKTCYFKFRQKYVFFAFAQNPIFICSCISKGGSKIEF